MIAIPLQITKKGTLMQDNVKRSIDQALQLLIRTEMGSWVSDRHYGFVFKNLWFEIFNENEGTVYDSMPSNSRKTTNSLLYKMKVSGSSKNISTFAAVLRDAIVDYEPRLDNVNVTLTYIREERVVYIAVRGVINYRSAQTANEAESTDYLYETKLKIWK